MQQLSSVHCSWPYFLLTRYSSQTPAMNSGWTIPYCRGFMMYISWSVTPNQRWLAEWRRVVNSTRQTIQIQSWTLELITNTEREWVGNQSHSVSLNLSVSLYLSFLSSGSQQLNLAVNFLAKSHRNLYVCVVPVMFRCKPLLCMMAFFFFYEFKRARVWTASYQFQPSVAWSFPQGCIWTMGEGKLAIPCSHKPLRLEH